MNKGTKKFDSRPPLGERRAPDVWWKIAGNHDYPFAQDSRAVFNRRNSSSYCFRLSSVYRSYACEKKTASGVFESRELRRYFPKNGPTATVGQCTRRACQPSSSPNAGLIPRVLKIESALFCCCRCSKKAIDAQELCLYNAGVEKCAYCQGTHHKCSDVDNPI